MSDRASLPAPHKGRAVIVTGGGRGIGLSIAQRLARDGAKVLVSDTDEQILAEAVKSLEAEGAVVAGYHGDLSLESEAEGMAALALDRFGTIDILVNNAGGGVILPFLEHTAETLRRTIDRNLWTAIWSCRAVLTHMEERRYGRILNIGADSVRNGLWNHAGYNAAKGGMHGLTTGLAREFATCGITVNTVAPCAVNTPQLSELREQNPELVERWLSVIPMARAAEMGEVASMVSYLASIEAGYITGQVVSVNGGSTML
ncbi:MAG: 2,3-dihydroxy-2,3-dihydro-p-cumate dehydrogenase [Leeuwenhoekiella sp.]|nr:MAG: 2,3-dihydroxy-2,3-dihydro-p-cumate dehydrogenase [Leeuwenhoekiella sp.]